MSTKGMQPIGWRGGPRHLVLSSVSAPGLSMGRSDLNPHLPPTASFSP